MRSWGLEHRKQTAAQMMGRSVQVPYAKDDEIVQSPYPLNSEEGIGRSTAGDWQVHCRLGVSLFWRLWVNPTMHEHGQRMLPTGRFPAPTLKPASPAECKCGLPPLISRHSLLRSSEVRALCRAAGHRSWPLRYSTAQRYASAAAVPGTFPVCVQRHLTPDDDAPAAGQTLARMLKSIPRNDTRRS